MYKKFTDMLHERPGVQTSRQADENQGIGDYQMHLDIMDLICVELPQPPIYIQHMIFGCEFGHWNFLWKHSSIRDFLSYQTNPIEKYLNLNKSQTHISSYLHISRLQTPDSIFYRLFAVPSVEPWSACYRRSTRFSGVHHKCTYNETTYVSSNAPCTSQWDYIHKLPTIEILVLLISTMAM